MRVLDCDISHAPAIRAIFNEVIATSTALYDYHPRSDAFMDEWFAAKARGGFPVMGVVSDRNELMGFASFGTFRAWPAFKYTVEHAVYVAPSHRRRGVGRLLLTALIERARQHDAHVMVGGIDADNVSSIALHTSLGFHHVATFPEVGFKFGRWLDLCFYQRTLDTPRSPRDG